MRKYLIVLLGPTGVGKTDLSIFLAENFSTDIVSSDSRQMFREMNIGTAVPEKEYLDRVKHHFIGNLSVEDYYNSWEYEKEAIALIGDLHKEKDVVLLVGGSMMYIDAVCNGIDDIPTIDKEVRDSLQKKYEEEGVESIRGMLRKLDPVFYNEVDLKNAKRVLHAVEVCVMAGKPYSELRTGSGREREFEIIKIGLNRDREELYDRINRRVDMMLDAGLIDEARNLHKYKHLNSLNTVGYKELFGYFDGEYDMEEAVRLIKRNSRRYAKRQLSWFNRDKEIMWFHPDDKETIMQKIKERMQ